MGRIAARLLLFFGAWSLFAGGARADDPLLTCSAHRFRGTETLLVDCGDLNYRGHVTLNTFGGVPIWSGYLYRVGVSPLKLGLFIPIDVWVVDPESDIVPRRLIDCRHQGYFLRCR